MLVCINLKNKEINKLFKFYLIFINYCVLYFCNCIIFKKKEKDHDLKKYQNNNYNIIIIIIEKKDIH